MTADRSEALRLGETIRERIGPPAVIPATDTVFHGNISYPVAAKACSQVVLEDAPLHHAIVNAFKPQPVPPAAVNNDILKPHAGAAIRHHV